MWSWRSWERGGTRAAAWPSGKGTWGPRFPFEKSQASLLLSVVPGVSCSKPSQSSISKLASFSLPSCWLLPSVDMRFSTVPNPLSMLLPFYLLFNCHFFSLSHHLSLYLVLIYRFMHFKGFATRICTGTKMSTSVQSMGFFLGYTLFIYSLIFHLIENNMILHLA